MRWLGMIALLGLVGCGSGKVAKTSSPKTTTTAAARSTTTGKPITTTTASARSSRCVAVSSEMTAAIASGLKVEGGGSLRGVQAVKSKDYSNVFFVSADIEGSGLEQKDDVATWATNSLTPGDGLIFAADAVAVEFSTWGDGRKAGPKVSPGDDGIAESRSCVQKVL